MTLIQRNGKGGWLISNKVAVTIPVLIFLLGITFNYATSYASLKKDMEHTIQMVANDHHLIVETQKDIGEIKITLVRLETILDHNLNLIDFSSLEPGDLVHVKIPYNGAITQEYWIELAAEDPVEWQ